MYLENIFLGSEDIRKQLPQESLVFDSVNRVFMQSMTQLHAIGNVVQATAAPGVLAGFQVGVTPGTCTSICRNNHVEWHAC